MTKRKYRWMSINISKEADRFTKDIARTYNVSQAKVLGILVTVEVKKLLARQETLEKEAQGLAKAHTADIAKALDDVRHGKTIPAKTQKRR